MESRESDLVGRQLREAEFALEKRMAEACATERARRADTGELIRIDRILCAASDAARRAIALRQRRRAERNARRTAHAAMDELEAELGLDGTHRILRDRRGVRWDIFAIYPEPHVAARAQLSLAYRHGWLCFETERETRRLSPVPDDWFRMTNDQLAALAEHAEVARTKS